MINECKPNIVKEYTVTGTHGQDMGRDLTKYTMYGSIKEAVRYMGSRDNEKFYYAYPVGEEFEDEVKKARKEIDREQIQASIDRRREKIEELSKEIVKLELEL